MKFGFYFFHGAGVWVRKVVRRGARRAVFMAMAVAFVLASLHELAYHQIFSGLPVWAGMASTVLLAMVAAGTAVWLGLAAYRHMARQQEDEVAARERLNRELSGERSLLRAMMEGTQDHIYFKDADSRFLRVNEAMARRFGLKNAAAAVGMTDFDLFPQELAEKKLADEKKVIETGMPVLGREELDTDSTGQMFWVSTSKMPMRDRNGKIIGTFGISRDITQRKLAEERQKAISSGLQKVLEIEDELIACEDEDGLFRRAVELGRGSLGLERCAIFIVGGDDVRGMFGTNLRGATTDERSQRFPRFGLWEERLRLRESSEKRWHISDETYHEWRENIMAEAGRGPVAVTPIQSSRHEVIGVFCNDNAISRKELDPAGQEVVAVYCSLLGNIVARKRAEREQRAVAQQQQSVMERTDRLNAVGMLAAGMAHEINNPLQGMLSHVRAIEPFVPPESSGRRSLEMVQTGIDTIASLVRRLLMLGSAGDGDRDGADVREAVDFVAQLLESQFRRTKVRIERHFSGQGIRVAMPRAEFIQILMNLLINARDAMPQGGVVRVEVSEAEGAARLIVSDTGQGIPPEVAGRIFAPFFTTKGSKGTGLGLSVTESLVRSCNGRIAAESVPGEGAKFIVTLPFFEGGRT